jgi:hypothetical protein
MVPVVVLPPATPFTDQLTLVLVEPVTVAPKGWVAETCTEALVGETDTDTAAGVMVTAAEALVVESAALVAATVTVAGEGTLAGAV